MFNNVAFINGKIYATQEYSIEVNWIEDSLHIISRIDTRKLNIGRNIIILPNKEYEYILVPTIEDLPDKAELGTYTHKFKL